MLQVPTATSDTDEPETVQTAGVVEAKLTVKPELAVAPIMNGAAPSVWLESAAKAMDWDFPVTVKLRSTGVAAA